MRWLGNLLFAVLLLSGAALGQAFTQVSGIAQNSGGQIYQNCTYNITFVGQSTEPGPYLLQGSTFQTSYAGVRCDGFGHFSIRLPSNQAIFPQPSSWMFNICDSTGRFCNAQGTGVITIAGAAQDITSIMTPLLPSIPTIGGGGAVESVFGRTGIVTAQAGDYTVGLVTGAAPLVSPTFTGTPRAPTVATTDSSTSLATTQWVKNQGYGTGTGSVTSVFGRTGVVTAQTGDYQFSQIGGTLSSSQLPTTGLVLSFNTRSGAVTPASGDYTVAQVTGAAPINNPTFTGTQNGVTAATADNSTRLATTAWVKLQGYSTGGASGVTSFNTRTGAVTSLAGDYTVGQVTGAAPLASPALTGTPTTPDIAIASAGSTQIANTNYVQQYVAAHAGGGGGVNPGTVNLLPKYVTTTTVGPSLVTDNGTTLTYAGTGGIVAPKFSHGTGAFQLDSVTAALPGLPGAGHNALVSGPDGWYISQDNAAFAKIATLVAAAPIALSTAMAPVCQAANTGGTANIPVTIEQGDTVVVGISLALVSPIPIPTVNDNGGSQYSLRISSASAATHSSWLLTTRAGGANNATTLTVVSPGTSKYVACVAAYKNVDSLGNTERLSVSAVNSATIGVTTQGPNSFAVGFIGTNTFLVVTPGTGTMLQTLGSSAGAAVTASLCHNTSPVAEPVSCGVTFSGNTAHDSLAIELREAPSGVGGGQGTAGVTSFNTRTGAVVPSSGDYTVSEVTGAAPLVSPTFTGTPHGPTAAQTVNNTQLATTAFVHSAVAAGGGGMGGSGTVTHLSKFSAAQTLTDSELTDSGTTLEYWGTGGMILGHAPATSDNSSQVPTTAWVKSQGYSTGGPSGVTSFNTRTGAVVPTTGDYTYSMVTGAAPLASPAFTGSPTAPAPAITEAGSQRLANTNYVKLYAAPLASPALTGTPTAPTAGQAINDTQIATTAYVRTAINALGTGVTSFNTRTGAIVPAAGDYTVAQVTGAAPLASPTFTGQVIAPTVPTFWNNTSVATTEFVHNLVGPLVTATGTENHLTKWHTTGVQDLNTLETSDVTDDGTTLHYPGAGGMTTDNPSPSDNSNRVATTAFVESALAAGGIARIGLSQGGSKCISNDNVALATLTFNVNITAGDTTLVSVSNSGVSGPNTTTTVTDNALAGSNHYTSLVYRDQGTGSTQMTTRILGSVANGSKAASEMTVTQSRASKFTVCVSTYVGVAAYGGTFDSSSSTVSSVLANGTVQDGGYFFVVAGITTQADMDWSVGTALNTKFSSSPTPAGLSICQNGSITATQILCVGRWSVSGFQTTAVGIELRPGVQNLNSQQYPRVLARHATYINSFDTAGATNYELCTPVICPYGVYRISFTAIVSGACTTGAGGSMPHLQYNDQLTIPPASRNLALLSPPGIPFTANNTVSGQHVFQNEGNANIYISTVGTACGSGSGGGNIWWILERLW